MKIAVGFITYNNLTSRYLPFFLPSLFKSLERAHGEARVWCIDNSDQAINENQEFIEANHSWVQYHFSGENVGFSKAYNQMIAAAIAWGADYFLMINPDTLLEPDSIKQMLSAINSGRFGSVAPRLLRWDFKNNFPSDVIDSDGLAISAAHRFWDRHQGEKVFRAQQKPIFGATGAAALFRMAALKDIAFLDEFGQWEYLDEMFFMYKEDVDLAYRLQLANWPAIFEPRAVIYHDRSVASRSNSLWSMIFDRRRKSRQVKEWSFYGQNLLWAKYRSLPFNHRIKIKSRVYHWQAIIFAFIFEPYLLLALKRLKREKAYIDWRLDNLKLKNSLENIEKMMFDVD